MELESGCVGWMKIKCILEHTLSSIGRMIQSQARRCELDRKISGNFLLHQAGMITFVQ